MYNLSLLIYFIPNPRSNPVSYNLNVNEPWNDQAKPDGHNYRPNHVVDVPFRNGYVIGTTLLL